MTWTFKTALMGCCLTVCPAFAQTVVQLPPMPDGGAGQVAALVLQNPTSAPIAARYITTGMVFPQGRVPSGQPLKVSIGSVGYVTRVQMDERTHWPDGSVRTAAVTFKEPGYQAGAAGGARFALANHAAGSPLSLAAITPRVATVDVTLGGHDYHLDVATLLAAGSPNYWLHGPLATEARVDAPITGAMHVTIDVRLYADGSSMLDVSYDNDLALASGGPETYTAAVKLGATTAPTVSITAQQPFTDWHQVVWSDGAPSVNVVHDIATLESTGMVPHYPLAPGVALSAITGQGTPFPCNPLGICGITPYMPTTGGRADIGVLPLWDVYWLQTQNAQAATYALEQADAAGSVPWHVEQTAGVPIDIYTYPQFWSDDRCSGGACSPMSYANADAGADHGLAYSNCGGCNGVVPDTAHMPELGYAAYLLTGRRHYLDELTAQAGFALDNAWTGVRQGYKGYDDLVIGAAQQLRAGAWSLREIGLAALALPDASALQAYFAEAATDNLAWIVADAGMPAKGQLAGWLDADYGSDNGAWAPWQNDFVALVVEWQNHAGAGGASAALSAMAPFLANRFDQAATVFSPYNGAAYNLQMGPSATQCYSTWSAVQQATIAIGESNTAAPAGPPPGSWAGDYGTAATSVVAGLPASAAQQQALAWVTAHPATSGPGNPVWVINP